MQKLTNLHRYSCQLVTSYLLATSSAVAELLCFKQLFKFPTFDICAIATSRINFNKQFPSFIHKFIGQSIDKIGTARRIEYFIYKCFFFNNELNILCVTN